MPAKPKWAQIADGIRAGILSGELVAGDKLPSTSQLCLEHGVSQIVVRQAINTLKAEGFIKGVPGLGTFVAERRE